jgi:hypothetical protein
VYPDLGRSGYLSGAVSAIVGNDMNGIEIRRVVESGQAGQRSANHYFFIMRWNQYRKSILGQIRRR